MKLRSAGFIFLRTVNLQTASTPPVPVANAVLRMFQTGPRPNNTLSLFVDDLRLKALCLFRLGSVTSLLIAASPDVGSQQKSCPSVAWEILIPICLTCGANVATSICTTRHRSMIRHAIFFGQTFQLAFRALHSLLVGSPTPAKDPYRQLPNHDYSVLYIGLESPSLQKLHGCGIGPTSDSSVRGKHLLSPPALKHQVAFPWGPTTQPLWNWVPRNNHAVYGSFKKSRAPICAGCFWDDGAFPYAHPSARDLRDIPEGKRAAATGCRYIFWMADIGVL